MSSRNRPLHACGVSVLAIADITFEKSQNINGPLGTSFRRIAKLEKFATPFIYTMEYQFLAILAFIDDRILFLQKITEILFPPSKYLFDKIDHMVFAIMSLPERFNNIVNKFPSMIHEFPFLEWVLLHVISNLNSLVLRLNRWGMENTRMNEKTIGVDRSCSEEAESENVPMDSVVDSESMESFPPISEVECKNNNNKEVQELGVSSHIKGSYKEALLERGKDESCSNEEVDGDGSECEGREKDDGINEEIENLMKYQLGKSEGNKDPLLELFESAWLMKPNRN